MTIHDLKIRGARTHNLKNINVDIPRNNFTVITGLSGSGKSSLAFDTLYAEGQRRYVESLSSYARQFLSMMEKPDVDSIEGLSPAISIEQKATSHNPRSTVGTVTEIYDYLRLLFARVGEPRCPVHQTVLHAKTAAQMVETTLKFSQESKWMILAPVIRDRKGTHKDLLQSLLARGYVRARINGNLYELDSAPALGLRQKHTIEVVVDRFKIRPEMSSRLLESFENALKLADGLAIIAPLEDLSQPEQLFSQHHACLECGYTIAELEPRLFSFNNPNGACASCTGLGVEHFLDPNRIVPNPDLSIYEGAIKGWENRGTYYYDWLKALAKHYKFDLKTPFKDLKQSIQQIIFFGSGTEGIYTELSGFAGLVRKKQPFMGIIPYLERKYRHEDHMAENDAANDFLSTKSCEACFGTRLGEAARHVYIQDHTIANICAWSIDEALKFFKNLDLPGAKGEIAAKINKELIARLGFLVDVGLTYLSLDRSAETLSGGEAQRIRLASQIGSGLVGVMYILDEPSIGLHQRDNTRLLKTLFNLRDLGNTVIVVEHDEDAIRSADYLIDMGPGAGVHGGEVVACGHPKQIMQQKASLTGQYLAKNLQIEVPNLRHVPDSSKQLQLRGVNCNNLKKLDVDIPIGLFTCITGVSGSGKSSLINDTLYPWAANILNRANYHVPGHIDHILGLNHCDKVIAIDQSPIGRTPRSNAATYTGMFTTIRELFAATPESRARGYLPGRFSFNVKGGRCESCQGDGLIKVEMHFLPDMYVPCDACHGSRYQQETLTILYKGKTIEQVLAMTVETAREFFDPIPSIARKCQTLIDVGLGYIQLGQSATTLSGGEAQRVKLSKELSKRDTGNTLYILDEPTTGLHMHDVKQLLTVLFRLRDKGNTVIVIEHNLDVIKTADWIIDLGPEGGVHGGKIVASGTPEKVAQTKNSHTGLFLKTVLAK